MKYEHITKFIFAILLFYANNLSGQSNFVILEGNIKDSVTNYIIPDAMLQFPDLDRIEMVKKGTFKIALPKGKVIALCYSEDYSLKLLELNLISDTNMIIRLNPVISSLQLDEVTVSAKSNYKIKANNSGLESLNNDLTKDFISLGGEQNLLMSITSLPGVQNINEGSGALSVRGNQSAENLYLIDGAPVFSISSFYGLLSPFDPFDFSEIKLYKGRIPSQFGGRLSGVLSTSIRIDSLNQKTINVGLLSNSLKYASSSDDNKWQWTFKIKRSYFDVLKKIADSFSQTSGSYPHYLNGIAKISCTLNDHSSISLSAYYDQDKLIFQEKYDSSTIRNTTSKSNKILTFQLNSELPKYARNDLNISYTGFSSINESLTSNGKNDEILLQTSSSIDYFQFKDVFQKVINKGMLYGGIEYSVSNVKAFNEQAGLYQHPEITPNTGLVSSLSLFTEGNYRLLNERLKSTLGFRTIKIIDDDQNWKVLPNAELNMLFTENLSLSAFYTSNYQFLDGITNSGMGFPFEFYISTINTFEPSESNSYGIALTLDKKINKQHYSLYSSVYRKTVSHSKLFTGSLYFANGYTSSFYILPRPLLSEGNTDIQGFELSLEKKTGTTRGRLSYCYTNATNSFPEINDGKEFIATTDRPADISFDLVHAFNKKWSVNAQWKFISGKPITIPTNIYINPENEFEFESDSPLAYEIIGIQNNINNARGKAYHRLDISVAKNLHPSKLKGATLNIGIYNVYNRKNPYFYYLGTKALNDDFVITLYSVSLFPIIPYVSLSLQL